MIWESTAIASGLNLLVLALAAVVTARIHRAHLAALRLRPGLGLILLGLSAIAALHLAELTIAFGLPLPVQRPAVDSALAGLRLEWRWMGTALGLAVMCAGVLLVLRAAGRAKGLIEANVARRERALAESEAVERPFRDLVADSIQGMIVHSDETVRYANRAAAEMYGFDSPEEMIGIGVDDLIAPEEHIRHRDFLAAPGRQQAPEHYVYKAVKKDGTRFWIENRVGGTTLEGRPAIHATHVDVSRRVASEQALRRSEAWLQTILNTAADGIVTMDGEGRLIGMNPAAQRLFGYSLDEAVGQPVAELLIPEAYRERHREGLRRFLATGEGPALQDKLEVEALTRSGDTVPVEIVINHMEHDHDVFFTAFVRDISERKAAEERLRGSEQKFRSLIEDQAAGVMIHRGRKALLANQALVDMLGFASAEEICALDDVTFLVVESDRERMRGYGDRRRAGLPAPERYEARWRRADGTVIWMELTPRIIDYEGEPAHQVVLTDITERKRAEADLLRKTAHLELMQKVAVAANEARTPEEAIRTCIDEVCRFAGWPVGHAYLLAADGAERLDPSHIWHLDDPRRFADFRRVTDATSIERGVGLPGRVLASGKPAWIVDVTRDDNFPRARAMGNIGVRAGFGFPLLVGSQVVGVLEFFATEGRDPDPKLLELMGHVGAQLGRAIERKRAENALATQQRLLKTVLDVLPVQICVKDDRRRFLMINQQLAEDTDTPEERWLGRTTEELGIVPRNAQRILHEEDEALLAGGAAIDVTQRALRLRGREEEVFHVRKIPLRGPDGATTGIVTMYENISERKRAEDELRTSQQLISTVINTVPNPISLKDLEGRFRVVNEALCQRHGRTEAELLGRTLGELEHLDREERHRITLADAQVIRSGRRVDIPECALHAADGTVRWQQITKVPVRNGAGEVIGVCGIGVDLTERKAVEDRLRASEARFRAVLDVLPVHVSVKDRDSRYVTVNALQLRNFATSEASLLGKSPEELPFVHKELAAAVRAEDERVLATGAAWETAERCFDLPLVGHRVFHVRKIPLRAAGGEIEGVVSVAEDVTERKRAEERLRAGEQKYRALFEEQVAGVMIHRDGKALLTNQAQVEMFGYDSPEEIYALDDVMALVAESDRPFIASLREAFARGETTLERFEMKALRKDGSEFWIDTTRRLIDWEGGPAIQTLTVDITERKRAEEELRASQHLLSTVFDTLPNPIFLKNPDGRYRLVNRAMAGTHGLQPEALIGRGIKDLPWLRRAERRRLVAADRAVLERGERVDIPELAVRLSDGEERWRRIVKVPLKNDRGEIEGILGLAEDITERKLAEDRLRANEALLRTVLDVLPVHVAYKDAQLRYRVVNGKLGRDLGVPAEEWIGKTVHEVGAHPPAERQRIHAEDKRILRTGEPLEIPHREHRLADGRLHHFHVRKVPLRDAQGLPIAVVSMYEDTTERKRAEDQVRQSEAQFRDLAEGSVQGIAIVRDHKALYANQAHADTLGFDSVEEVLALPSTLELVPDEDRDAHVTLVRRLMSGELTYVHEERRRIRRDGRIIWRDDFLRSVNWQGEPAIQLSTYDITPRKEAEAELKASEERYRDLVEGQLQGVLISRRGKAVLANPRFLEIMGCDRPEEIYGLEDVAEVVHPDDREMVWRYRAARLAGEPVPERYEIRYVRKDGTVIWAENLVRPLIWEGEPASQVIAVDITERKRAEEALVASETRLREAQAIGHVGSWEVEIATGISRWSDETYRIFGLAPQERPVTFDDFIQLVHPEDRDELLAVIEEATRRHAEYGHEFRMIQPSGDIRHISTRGGVICDEQGGPSHRLGTTQDVTEQKLAELALSRAEQRYRDLVEGSLQGIAITDADRVITFANQALADIYGYDAPESMLGRSAEEMVPPRELGRLKDIHRVRPAGETVPTTHEFEVRRSDGTPAWIEVRVRTIFYVDHVAFQSTHIDITERKQAEQELRASQRLMRTVIDALPLMLSMKSCDGRMSMVNATVLRYLHAGESEVVGHRTSELEQLDAEYRAESDALDHRVKEEERTVEVPAMEITMAGKRELGRLMKIPVFGEDERLTGIVTLFEIVTERVEAERRRLESETRFRNLIEGSIQGVAIHDREAVMFANQAWAGIFGYETVDDAIFEMAMPEHMAPERRDVMLDYLDYLVEGHEPRGILRDRFLRRDGTPIWLEGNTILVEWGGEFAFQSTVVDVTDRVQAEERAESQRRQLIQADKMTSLGVLVSGVAHEINNPNNAISMDTPLLAQIWDDAEPILREHGPAEGLALGGLPYERALTAVPQMLQRIAKGSERIKRIVDRLKSFARKRDQRDMRAIALNDVVESSVSLLQSQIDKCTVSFSVHCESSLPPVRADFQEIEQVVINLIANACEALPARESAVRVLTWHDPDTACVGVDVVDEGTGISEEHLTFVMDPFFTTKRARGGTGLGLSVSFSIVEDHDGDLQIHSTLGEGTTARLTLPVADPE